jgi:hypothetical protein
MNMNVISSTPSLFHVNKTPTSNPKSIHLSEVRAEVHLSFPPMASIPALLFLALSLSMGGIMILKPHTIGIYQNRSNSTNSFAAPFFLFSLLSSTFFSAITLLFLHFSIPQSAYTKYSAFVTGALTSATLLFGAVPMIAFTLTAAAIPDSIKTTIVVVMLGIAQISFVRSSFNISSYFTTGFIPVLFNLCISAGALFLVQQPDSSNNTYTLIHLLLFCNFTVAMVLLFLHASATSDGPAPRHPISAAMIERLAKTTATMSFTTVLIGVYMTVGIYLQIC